MGQQAAAQPYHRTSVGGLGHIWVPEMPYFETPSPFPAKARFVGFLASKHGQSFPASASRKRIVGDKNS